jgi:hypothetical protein
MLEFLRVIDNSKFDVQDPKAFRIASASIVCDIVGKDEALKNQFCSLFKEEFELTEQEFDEIKGCVNPEESLDQNVATIKQQLQNNPHKIADFLKIINKFIIEDHCKDSDYCEFEAIRDKFLTA